MVTCVCLPGRVMVEFMFLCANSHILSTTPWCFCFPKFFNPLAWTFLTWTQYMCICAKCTLLFPNLTHLIKETFMVYIRWEQLRSTLWYLLFGSQGVQLIQMVQWERACRESELTDLQWLFSVSRPHSIGSMDPHGLKSCWGYTELGSQILNTLLDSASIKKERSQFQTF